MPVVDIPGPTNKGINPTGLPTPVLLAVVGGGIGLIVFLSRKMNSSNTDPNNPAGGTLLPNTAIMLGSLQADLLNVKGDVTQGNADLSSQLTGVGESLGTQIDTQTIGINTGFANLSTYLANQFAAITGQENALSTAIAGLGTQNAGLASSLTTVLGGLQQISTDIAKGNQTQDTILANQNAQSTLLNSLGQSLNSANAQDRWIFAENWNQYAGHNQMWSSFIYYDPKTTQLTYNAKLDTNTGVVSDSSGKPLYNTKTGQDLQYNILSTGQPGSQYNPTVYVQPIPTG